MTEHACAEQHEPKVGRRLSSEEIAATPLPPGFVFKCYSRRSDKPNEILLHLECPRGHQIIKPRTTASGGCDTCRRDALRKGAVPDDWRERIAGLAANCGLQAVATALGVAYETVTDRRYSDEEFKLATRHLLGVPHRGSKPGARGPERATLDRRIAELEQTVAELQKEKAVLKSHLRDHDPRDPVGPTRAKAMTDDECLVWLKKHSLTNGWVGAVLKFIERLKADNVRLTRQLNTARGATASRRFS